MHLVQHQKPEGIIALDQGCTSTVPMKSDKTIARQQAEIQRLTVANQAALQQLKELQEVKQKLGLLEATVNKFLASDLSVDHDELISAGRVSAYLSEQTGR